MKKINYFIIIGTLLVDIFLILKTFITGNFEGILDYLCVFPVFLLPVVLNRFSKTRLTDKEEFLYLVFVFISDFLGSVVNLYDMIEWFDTLTHFIFGLSSGALGIYVLTKTKLYDKRRYYTMAFMFILISLAGASIWEMYEFIVDTLFNTNLQSLETGVVDTMEDMITSTIGILIFCYFYIRKLKSVPKRKLKRK